RRGGRGLCLGQQRAGPPGELRLPVPYAGGQADRRREGGLSGRSAGAVGEGPRGPTRPLLAHSQQHPPHLVPQSKGMWYLVSSKIPKTKNKTLLFTNKNN